MPAAPRGRPPAGMPVAARKRRTLLAKPGRRLHARRTAIVESGFWPIKPGRGVRQFLWRGKRMVRGHGRAAVDPQGAEALESPAASVPTPTVEAVRTGW
jgi:hypothetical protein